MIKRQKVRSVERRQRERGTCGGQKVRSGVRRQRERGTSGGQKVRSGVCRQRERGTSGGQKRKRGTSEGRVRWAEDGLFACTPSTKGTCERVTCVRQKKFRFGIRRKRERGTCGGQKVRSGVRRQRERGTCGGQKIRSVVRRQRGARAHELTRRFDLVYAVNEGHVRWEDGHREGRVK
ncbi:hypothetical protein DPMN_008146 [Dreissena polymorpha]|uniref:Uncharacterized protein n=1 Tax=Dreissena polymorpha TaxID=45954 RepID=A0A9D4RYZ5_DREPO|nr:hypothetical protein DPMN_008146 [Dreissena polymorpha]